MSAYGAALSNFTFPATGSAIHDPRLLDRNEYEANEQRTHVTLAGIADPVLRETLTWFDDVLGFDQVHAAVKLAYTVGNFDSERYGVSGDELKEVLLLVRWLRSDAGLGRVLPYVTVGELRDLPVASPDFAVGQVADVLGLPVVDILKAAGISKRTYHAWKKNKVKRPRRDSLGRLWELHELVYEILELKGSAGIRHWISGNPDLVKLLRSGSFEEFAARAYNTATKTPRPDWASFGGPTERLVVGKTSLELQAMDPSDIVEPES